MSDGNFNRALLPHTPYESGLKMGKAMARKYAAEVFADFIREWFIPFDTHCAIVIKHHNHPFVLGDALTLDYNTETHEHSSTQHIDTNRNPL